MSAPAFTPRSLPACRYYGMSHTVLKAAGLLRSQGGNECAVIFDSFAPCKMERLGFDPDETRCPIARGYLRRTGEL